ncbi:AEC family transporter [Rhodopseudomonas palustris]|uniref:Auxin Efflux Carrier n=1 Tax=Rhodopseudomonas palustris (strain BisB18) TaxID=316056 RepID=Q20XM8_RHOPB
MAIFESLSGVFSCMLMILLGYYLTQIKWFNKEIGQLFSKFAMTVTIPLYMIVSMMKSYKKEDLLQLGVAVIVPLCSMFTLWLIGIVVSKLFKVPDYRRGAFRAMFFVSNSAFIGFPVNIALFGDKALPIAVMYYLVQSLLFWTIGAYGLSIDGPKFARLEGGDNADVSVPKVLSLKTIKNIMSPPLIGAVVAISLILLSVKLPTFATSTMTYLGSMTTPLAMLFIGIAIYIANLRSVRITLDMGILIAARFLIAPAVTVLACYLFEVPSFMRNVLIIESSMPVMTQVSIAARAYKADANYVAVMTALTTVLALFTIPTYFILLTFGIL